MHCFAALVLRVPPGGWIEHYVPAILIVRLGWPSIAMEEVDELRVFFLVARLRVTVPEEEFHLIPPLQPVPCLKLSTTVCCLILLFREGA